MQKTIVITGCSQGIGLSLTEYFLKKSYKVIGVSRSRPEIDHEQFLFLSCDLAKVDQVQLLASKLLDHRIDIFIHGAMYTPKHKMFVRYSAEDLQIAHQVCSISPMMILQKIVPKMRKLDCSQIIFLGSMAQELGMPGQMVYITAKSALYGLARSLDAELSEYGVIVKLLLLGPVETPKLLENLSEEALSFVKKSMPDKQLLSLDQVNHDIELILKDLSNKEIVISLPLGAKK